MRDGKIRIRGRHSSGGQAGREGRWVLAGWNKREGKSSMVSEATLPPPPAEPCTSLVPRVSMAIFSSMLWPKNIKTPSLCHLLKGASLGSAVWSTRILFLTTPPSEETT